MTKKHAKLPSMQSIKAPVTTAADHILIFSQENKALHFLRIVYITCQALFS